MFRLGLTYLVFALAVLCSCGDRIIRQEIPEESVRVDVFGRNRAVSKNILGEVSIRHMDKSEIKRLAGTNKLRRLLFFQVLIKNTGSFPLFLTEISANYGSGSVSPPVTENIQPKKLRQLMKPQRIIRPEFYFGNFFPEDVIQYKLDFIAPEDTVAFIIALEYPPPSVRKYGLLFRLSAGGRNGAIAFTLNRAEFRTKGRDFVPRPDITEDFF